MTAGERKQTPLLQRKLRPPPQPEPLLHRPRLERLLADLVARHRVVVVAATAGSGKTTTTARAVGLLDRPVAWLSVDRTDSAPGRLVTYLEGAIGRQLPDLAVVATNALAAGVPHPEAAGLLAEAIGETPLLLVLDDLERLGESAESWAVIEALVRYAPAHVRIILVSRREIPPALCVLPPGPETAALPDVTLAFTPDEASAALSMLGESPAHAQTVVDATGGWVMGVLFEAWRSEAHVPGGGGEVDPLDGYLASQILEQLGPSERDFLITTSVLEEVTADRAAALGEAAPGERLAALRASRLPVVWEEGAMRSHPRFREHLLRRLERGDPARVSAIRVAYGQLLAGEGYLEDATEELLRAGAPEAALQPATSAIFGVIERLDFAVAERWLTALADVAPSGASPLTIAELLLAIAADDYRRGARVLDQLAQLGERDELVATSDRAAALGASCYVGVGRLEDAHAVIDAASPGREIGVVRYMMPLYEPGPAQPRPSLDGGPMDGVLLYCDYLYGRLGELATAPVSRWADAVARPWQIAARCAMGYTQEALVLYQSSAQVLTRSVGLAGCVGPEVLLDAGHRDEAYAAVERGEAMARDGGAIDLWLLNRLVAVKLALRFERDPETALDLLDRIEREPHARSWPFIAGPAGAWRGCALLMRESPRADGHDIVALTSLRRAVQVMSDAQLLLELPAAAVYLAEAEWRGGNEDAADCAADLALDASRRLGSNHRMLQALADFPAVVARRIDAEPGVDSPWHELGRALLTQGVPVPTHIGDAIELREFGTPTLLVDGQEVRLRIGKSYELLAFLLARRGVPAERDELLDALFDGRADDSTRSYLRQAVHWVRRALPDGALITGDGRFGLSADVLVTSDSSRFEQLLAEAARLHDVARLSATREALALCDRGEYLAGMSSGWSAERRREMALRAVEARGEAAELAFAAGRYREARELAEEVLEADALREATWRLVMRIASALGDDDGALGAFRACTQALAQIGSSPSPSTRRLLESLRR